MNGSSIYRSNNVVYARFEILRDGGVWTDLYAYEAPEVQCVTTSALKMSLRGTFYRPEKDVNYLTDRIRAVLCLNGQEYNMGVYIATTADELHTDEGDMVEIEAYSMLYLASRAKLEGVYHIDAGTNYISAVQSLLVACGITDYEADATSLKMPMAREDWEEGTPVLDVINELLDEINYNSAWVDLNGKVRLTKYTGPSTENIKHTYREGEYSVLYPEYTASTDLFDKANVFKCVCSNPDLSVPLVAVAVNEDPHSKFSTVSLGARVLYLENVDNVPDLDTLQERADNLRIKSLQTTQEVEFSTALVPGHETFDTIAIDSGEITGIYTETEWRATMDAAGIMTHRAKRVIE